MAALQAPRLSFLQSRSSCDASYPPPRSLHLPAHLGVPTETGQSPRSKFLSSRSCTKLGLLTSKSSGMVSLAMLSTDRRAYGHTERMRSLIQSVFTCICEAACRRVQTKPRPTVPHQSAEECRRGQVGSSVGARPAHLLIGLSAARGALTCRKIFFSLARRRRAHVTRRCQGPWRSFDCEVFFQHGCRGAPQRGATTEQR